uniref:C2H2-type domain-containing protein n=1 Tax=Tetranychus urticae TaxID=32264 RepID=T1JUA4_TETUR
MVSIISKGADNLNSFRSIVPKRNDKSHSTTISTINNQKKRYSCDQCSYSTDRRDLYRRHENIHRDEKPFRCYVCNKMFNRADHVKKHFLRIHKGLEYNVKLIKRINGVDYTASNGNHTTNGPPNTNNNSINNSNIASDKSQTNGLKSLPTFNLALWNEESNRLLLENYSSQSKYTLPPRQSQSQLHSNSQLPQLSHQSTHRDGEPLCDSNGQSNDQRDLLNIMNDAGLTLCLKLNGSNNVINGRTSNADKSSLISCFSTKMSSHVNSPRSTPPTPSPSPPFNDIRGINIFKGSIPRNQENRRSTYDMRSVCATQNHRKPTSLLSPINCKTSSPPQTIATSLVKPKCLDKNENAHQYVQPDHQMTITSLNRSKSKASHITNINNGCNIIDKVDEMIKMSENEFNRRLLESMGSSSSSTLLAERDSFPHATLIFNTETSKNSKKTNWFNRLNPVRVNTVSSVLPITEESNERPNSSSSQATSNNDKKYSDKYSEEEISSETWQSDEISIDESDIIEEVDSEDDNYLEMSQFKDEDDDKIDIYLHEIKSNTFDCEYCGCSFANYKSLHTHRYLLHQYINKQNNLYPYSCVICGKRSSTQKQMINHMVNHNGLRNSRKYSRNGSASPSMVPMKSSIRKNRRKQSEPKRVAM